MQSPRLACCAQKPSQYSKAAALHTLTLFIIERAPLLPGKRTCKSGGRCKLVVSLRFIGQYELSQGTGDTVEWSNRRKWLL